jgi:predicted dinucleotide-binding enzyme
MKHSIIGSGNVGSALARYFARVGIAVGIANRRGPETLTALADELGPSVVPQTVEDALNADVVILALPFAAHSTLTHIIPDWRGRIAIDATNTYGIPNSELGGRASTDIVASALPGARVVKTFNQLPAKLLALNPAESGGRRVMFVSSNDEHATKVVLELVEKLGFAAISLGRIAESSPFLSRGGALVLQNLIKRF